MLAISHDEQYLMRLRLIDEAMMASISEPHRLRQHIYPTFNISPGRTISEAPWEIARELV